MVFIVLQKLSFLFYLVKVWMVKDKIGIGFAGFIFKGIPMIIWGLANLKFGFNFKLSLCNRMKLAY